MNVPTWRQRRRGEFVANVIPEGQCGFTRGQHRFTYDVKIVVNHLDDNNWVLDNRELDILFDTWSEGHWQASCEALAGGGVNLILDVLGDRAEEIVCVIIPNAYAELECHWRRGDGRPHAPRKITITSLELHPEAQKEVSA